MSHTWESFVPFISRLQLERIRALGRARDAPVTENLHGTMLFLDIVAFSEVTEQFSDQGPKGAEVLSELLHAYFRPVLDTIRGHGGDILFFAGDALGIVWKAASGATVDVGEAAVRGAQCALAIQTLIPTIEPPWGSPLRFRTALGTGSLEALEVGGEKGRWMQMVRGQALDRVRRADRQAARTTWSCLRIVFDTWIRPGRSRSRSNKITSGS